MFPSLSQEIQDELTQLAHTYGTPLIRTVNLGISTMFDPLNKTDRYGEVCMVVRRPNGRLLTMLKTFYPQGTYRLLTGGINHGERVYDALLREAHEETGLEVKVSRFLTALAYCLNSEHKTPVFYTFAFLLDEMGGTLGAIDEDERVEAFREIAVDDLPVVAEHLRNVQHEPSREIGGNWKDWGKFRAAVHEAVYDARVGV
ncbi:MAG: NUDIX hydrolase [Ktedonobacteraceae bacterium]